MNITLLKIIAYPLGLLLGMALVAAINSGRIETLCHRLIHSSRFWLTASVFTIMLSLTIAFYYNQVNARGLAVTEAASLATSEEITYAEQGTLLPLATLPDQRRYQTYGAGEGVYLAYQNTPESAAASPLAILVVKNGSYNLTTMSIAHRFDLNSLKNTGTAIRTRTYHTYAAARQHATSLLPKTQPSLTRT